MPLSLKNFIFFEFTLSKEISINVPGLTLISFLNDLIDYEWKHSEKNGGMTFMGKTVKGVTRAIMSVQNQILYDGKRAKN